MKLLSDKALKARGILTIGERRAKFPFTVAEVMNNSINGDVYILPADGQSLAQAVESWQENAGIDNVKWRETVYLARTAYKDCKRCGTTCLEDTMLVQDVYQSPWDDKPKLEYHCSSHCEERENEGDFSPITCDACGSSIVQRCTSNGWHEYFRKLDGNLVCLKCYQEGLEKVGIDRADIVKGKAPGMFFNRGELADKGWHKIASYVLPGADMPRYQADCLAVIDAGGRIIVEYDRMAIGGLEGYITVWSKVKGEK